MWDLNKRNHLTGKIYPGILYCKNFSNLCRFKINILFSIMQAKSCAISLKQTKFERLSNPDFLPQKDLVFFEKSNIMRVRNKKAFQLELEKQNLHKAKHNTKSAWLQTGIFIVSQRYLYHQLLHLDHQGTWSLPESFTRLPPCPRSTAAVSRLWTPRLVTTLQHQHAARASDPPAGGGGSLQPRQGDPAAGGGVRGRVHRVRGHGGVVPGNAYLKYTTTWHKTRWQSRDVATVLRMLTHCRATCAALSAASMPVAELLGGTNTTVLDTLGTSMPVCSESQVFISEIIHCN